MPNKPDKFRIKYWIFVEVSRKYCLCVKSFKSYLGRDEIKIKATYIRNRAGITCKRPACAKLLAKVCTAWKDKADWLRFSTEIWRCVNCRMPPMHSSGLKIYCLHFFMYDAKINNSQFFRLSCKYLHGNETLTSSFAFRRVIAN